MYKGSVKYSFKIIGYREREIEKDSLVKDRQRHWLSDCNLCLGFGFFFFLEGGCLLVAKSDMTLELDRTCKLNTTRYQISKLWVKTYRDNVIFGLTRLTYLIYVSCSCQTHKTHLTHLFKCHFFNIPFKILDI